MPPMRTLPHLVRGPQYNQGEKQLQHPRLLRTWDSFELGRSTLDQSISLRSVKVGKLTSVPCEMLIAFGIER